MRNFLLESTEYNPWKNLAIEKYLADRVQSGDLVFYLWQNDKTVVIGRNQNALRECNAGLLEEEGGYLARRLTGGGAVYQDMGNLCFTFLASPERYDLTRQMKVVQKACRKFGIETELSGRNDIITEDGYKFSGNAFSANKTCKIQHGTLMIDVDKKSLSRYLTPSEEKLKSKGVKSVESRVCNLKEINADVSVETMKMALMEAYADEYGAYERMEFVKDTDIQETYKMYASWDWRYGKSPECETVYSKRFAFGEVQIHLKLKNLYIEECKVYSDSLDVRFPEKVEKALVNQRYDETYILQTVKGIYMNNKIVAAGHICLDITPAFPDKEVTNLGDVLTPGQLLQMGSVDVHTGGSVANTGLGLKVLGANVTLMGKIGNDAFGELVYSQLKEYDAHHGMIISDDVNTSYSVVLAPKGFDRIFLHHSGANDEFYKKDLDFSQIEDATLFHFGYPPLMKSMYQNEGKELVEMFSEIKRIGVFTSMDMAAVDESSPAGQADWEGILKQVLPCVDFFVPSVEELAFMIDRERFYEWKKRAAGRDITMALDVETDIKPLGEKLLGYGAKVVLIKCGAPGLFMATADEKQLTELDSLLEGGAKAWANLRVFEKSYKPEKVLSGTGAGDTSIAAFLQAIVTGHTSAECLQLATATGASCVAAYDALSGLKSFEELKERIQNGWEKN